VARSREQGEKGLDNAAATLATAGKNLSAILSNEFAQASNIVSTLLLDTIADTTACLATFSAKSAASFT
jgi:hypothetical protein